MPYRVAPPRRLILVIVRGRRSCRVPILTRAPMSMHTTGPLPGSGPIPHRVLRAALRPPKVRLFLSVQLHTFTKKPVDRDVAHTTTFPHRPLECARHTSRPSPQGSSSTRTTRT